jgi:hypothetical protein
LLYLFFGGSVKDKISAKVIQRIVSIFMAAVLLLYTAVIPAQYVYANTDGRLNVHPIITHMGVPIYDGMVIPAYEILEAEFTFEIGTDAFTKPIILPYPLEPADFGTFAVHVVDNHNNVVSGTSLVIDFFGGITLNHFPPFADDYWFDNLIHTDYDYWLYLMSVTVPTTYWATFSIPCYIFSDDDFVTVRSGDDYVTIEQTRDDWDLDLFEPLFASFPILDPDTDTFIDLINADFFAKLWWNGIPANAQGQDVNMTTDTFGLQIDFEIDPNVTGALRRMIDDGTTPTFHIPRPYGLNLSVDPDDKDIHISFDGITEYKFAEIFIQNGEPYITFIGTGAAPGVGNFWTLTAAQGFFMGLSPIENGYLYFNGSLNADEIDGEFAFNINAFDRFNFPIFITNHKLSEASISKSVDFANNRFTWTITYEPGERDITDNLTIRDAIGGNHMFVPDSFEVLLPGGTYSNVITDSTVVPINVITQRDISFVIPPSLNKQRVQVRYQTRLTDELLDNAGTPNQNGETVTNDARLFEGNSTTPLDTATASHRLSAGQMQWVSKTGIQDGRNHILWRITVNTNDRNLRDLILYDLLPSEMELVPNSITVNGVNINDVNSIARFITGSSAYSFGVEFTDPPYLPIFVVEYKTTIDESHFDNPGNDNLSADNLAWLEFNWEFFGTGGIHSRTMFPPTFDRPFQPTANVIAKSPISYDRRTGQITWEVRINPFGVAIAEGELIDELYKFGQTYVPGSFTVISYPNNLPTNPAIGLPEVVGGVTIQNAILNVDVGALGTNGATFRFKSQVTDPDHFASNNLNGVEYHNTIEFIGEIGGSIITSRSSASISVRSQMISKGRDLSRPLVTYEDVTIGGVVRQVPVLSWEITVNQNRMMMQPGVSITDTLPQGLVYVPGSVSTNVGTVGATFNDGTRLLTITPTLPPGHDETFTVRFRTYIDTSNPAIINSFNRDTLNIQFTNTTASLTQGSFSSVDSSQATITISNKMMEKTYTRPNNVEVLYNVHINMNGGIVAGQVITDILPEGLRLDVNSVVLRAVRFNSNGELEPIVVDSVPIEWRFDSGIFNFAGLGTPHERFSLTLPGNYRYILSYDCFVSPGFRPPFVNNIVFGTQQAGANASDRNATAATSGGAATSNRMAFLDVTIQDGFGRGIANSDRSGIKLNGVRVTLVQNVAGTRIEVASGITGSHYQNPDITDPSNPNYLIRTDGMVRLFPVRPGTEYTIEVNGVPVGYIGNVMSHVSNSPRVTFTTNDANILLGTSTVRLDSTPFEAFHSLVLEINPTLGNMSFRKTHDEAVLNTWDNLAGVTFRITDQSPISNVTSASGSTYTRTAVSGADGLVSFTGVPFGRYTVSEESGRPDYHHRAANFDVWITPNGVFSTSQNDANIISNPREIRNVFYRPILTINQREQRGTPLTTFVNFTRVLEYSLFAWDGTNETLVETKSSAGGTVTFTLEGGKRYRVRINPAGLNVNDHQNGWYATDFLDIPMITSSTNFSREWRFYPHATTIRVDKRDSTRPGVVIQGVTFDLYRDSAIPANLIATGTTNASGYVTFANLRLSQNTGVLTGTNALIPEPALIATTFILVERSAAQGYVLNTTHHTAVNNAQGHTFTRAGIYTQTIMNDPTQDATYDGDIVFRLVNDDNGIPPTLPYPIWTQIPGGRFQLRDTTPNSNITVTAESDSNGNIIFTRGTDGFPFGTYELTQLPVQGTAYAFHNPGITPRYVIVGTDDTMTGDEYTLVNTRMKKTVAITVLDAITGSPIGNVPFSMNNISVHSRFTHTNYGTPVSLNSNPSGQVTFNNLLGGNNYRVDITTPTGYYPSEPSYTVGVVADQTQVNITWRLYPYDATLIVDLSDSSRPSIVTDTSFTAGLMLQGGTIELIGTTPTQLTNPDGLVTFTGLPLDIVPNSTTNNITVNGSLLVDPVREPAILPTTFNIRQIGTAPIGYTYIGNTISRTVTPTHYRNTFRMSIVNAPLTVDKLEFIIKCDAEDVPLVGVQFVLREIVTGRTPLRFEADSATGGVLVFEPAGGIPHGNYEIVKRVQYDNYVIDSLNHGTSISVGIDSALNVTVAAPVAESRYEIKLVRIKSIVEVLAWSWDDTVSDFVRTDAAFHLQRNANTINENDDGIIPAVFANLLQGAEYTLSATSPIGHYNTAVLTFDAPLYVTGAPPHETINWYFYPYAASIKITVIDEYYTGEHLAGAEFELFDINGVSVDTAITNAQGEAEFTLLELIQGVYTVGIVEPNLLATNYTLKQIGIPLDGYEMLTDTTVTFDGLSRTQRREIVINKKPTTATLSFTKLSEMGGGTPLAGVAFTLTNTDLSLPGSPLTFTSTSNSAGLVQFSNISWGTYILTETVTPPPHLPIADITFTINKDGSFAPLGTLNNGFANSIVNEISDSHVEILASELNGTMVDGTAFVIYRVGLDGENELASRRRLVTGSGDGVLFEGLYPLRNYRIYAEVPNGYYSYISDEFVEFTALEDESITVTWYLHPIVTGDITVTVESGRRGLPIETAGIAIYDENGSIEIRPSQQTDANGETVFVNLPLDAVINGKTVDGNGDISVFNNITILETVYDIRQLTTIVGYNKDDDTRTVKLNAATLSVYVPIVNYPLTNTVIFEHYSRWEMPLANTLFRLREINRIGSTLNMSGNTDTDGLLVFDDVPMGTYRLYEDSVVANHNPHITEYTITVDTNGDAVWSANGDGRDKEEHNGLVRLYNNFERVSLSIIYADAYTDKPLEGVEFEIISIYNGMERVNGNKTTDADGLIVFDNLMVGEEIKIRKVNPLNGYYPSQPHVLTLPTDTGDSLDIKWNAYPGTTITAVVLNSADKKPISNAAFGLYQIVNGTEIPLATAISDVDGKLLFEHTLFETSVDAAFDTPPVLLSDTFQIAQHSPYPNGFYRLANPVDIEDMKDETIIYLDPIILNKPDDDDEDDDNNSVNNNTPGSGGSGGGGGGTIVYRNNDASVDANETETVSGIIEFEIEDEQIIVIETETEIETVTVNEITAETETEANINDAIELGVNTDSEILYFDAPYFPFEIPVLITLSEDNIIRPHNITDGFSVVLADGIYYIIYDEFGVPLGYVIWTEEMDIYTFDFLAHMIPFGDVMSAGFNADGTLISGRISNPQTGVRKSKTVQMALLNAVTFAMLAWRRKRGNR